MGSVNVSDCELKVPADDEGTNCAFSKSTGLPVPNPPTLDCTTIFDVNEVPELPPKSNVRLDRSSLYPLAAPTLKLRNEAFDKAEAWSVPVPTVRTNAFPFEVPAEVIPAFEPVVANALAVVFGALTVEAVLPLPKL